MGIAEKTSWKNRFRRSPFLAEEEHERHDGKGEPTNDRGTCPSSFLTLFEAQHERRHTHGQQDPAEHVGGPVSVEDDPREPHRADEGDGQYQQARARRGRHPVA